MKTEENNPIAILNSFMTNVKEQGLAQLVNEAEFHDGSTVEIKGRQLKNFGSCGYMSLEFDPRVRQGGIEAIQKYGMQFSTSRIFISSPLYPMLEGQFEKMFQRPSLIAQSTTLGHLATLPTIVGPDDVVLMDQQVHSSVQLTAKVLIANGVKVDIVPHSNVARIEKKILAYKDTKKKIWYLGDGVYSMYGDCAPMEALTELLHKYEQFHLYLDDAHGMSVSGKNGKGYVLDKLPNHERLFLIASLAKGFGCAGAVITTPNVEMKQLIRNCGGTQLFSGPLQPPILGAALASTKIHLADNFSDLQDELTERIEYCNLLLTEQPLPLLSAPESAIKFLGVGPTEKAQAVVKHLMNEGYWLNIAQYPAVAPHHAGLRFMMTRTMAKSDIESLISAIKNAVEVVLGTDEEVIPAIWKAFNKEYRYSLIQG